MVAGQALEEAGAGRLEASGSLPVETRMPPSSKLKRYFVYSLEMLLI